MKKRYGFLSASGLITTLVTIVVIVGLVAINGYELFSPGPLSAKSGAPLGGVSSHAEIGGECSRCHTAPWQKTTMSDQCSACHLEIVIQQKDISTLHGSLFQNNSLVSCLTCHLEHNGSSSPLTNLQGLKFPHDTFGFSLDSHRGNIFGLDAECMDCHGGNFQYVESRACGNCHILVDSDFTQSHVLTFGVECLDCHDGKETYGKKFDHQKITFPLDGRHVDVNCSECHILQFTIEELRSTPQDCFECHADNDKHNGNLGLDCSVCHSPEDWKINNFDHENTSYSLIGKHAQTLCESCHLLGVLKGTSSVCNDCHVQDDKHEGKYGTECQDCHTSENWVPDKFNHSVIQYEITGLHTDVACEECHIGGDYKGASRECISCHSGVDPHIGSLGIKCENCHMTTGWLPANFNHEQSAFKLDGRHTSLNCKDCHSTSIYNLDTRTCYSCHSSIDKHKGGLGVACDLCHSTTTWKGASYNHSNTGFPLTGKHGVVTCEGCHSNGTYKGTPTTCIACHAAKDKHNGSFGIDCGTCHTTSTWTGATFNHNNTAFQLTGKHIQVNCAACHKNGVYKGTPTTCNACHAANDKHNGSFGTDCGTCHTTSTWTGATFNHNNTAFQLTGEHVQVNCAACHKNGVYKGTPTTCYACHAANDKHNGSFGTNCSSCHTTSTWSGATIDHNKYSFQLTGKHSNLECSKCHTNGVYQGTPTKCESCHKVPNEHRGGLNSGCEQCHNTNNWDAD